MPTTTSASPALLAGWDYSKPADSPEDRIIRLEEIVATLRKARTFANAQLACMNDRYAWGGVYVDGDDIIKVGLGVWDAWTGDDALLDRFIAVADRAVILISDTYSPDPVEMKFITRYTRSCSARLEWSKQLKAGRDPRLVLLAMMQYAENVKNSSDPVD